MRRVKGGEGEWCDVVCPFKTKPNDVGMNRGRKINGRKRWSGSFNGHGSKRRTMGQCEGNARTDEAVGSKDCLFLVLLLLSFFSPLPYSFPCPSLEPSLSWTTACNLHSFFTSCAELHEEKKKERKKIGKDTTHRDRICPASCVKKQYCHGKERHEAQMRLLVVFDCETPLQCVSPMLARISSVGGGGGGGFIMLDGCKV